MDRDEKYLLTAFKKFTHDQTLSWGDARPNIEKLGHGIATLTRQAFKSFSETHTITGAGISGGGDKIDILAGNEKITLSESENGHCLADGKLMYSMEELSNTVNAFLEANLSSDTLKVLAGLHGKEEINQEADNTVVPIAQ